MNNIEQYIKGTVIRKHDIALRLRSIVIDPIARMNRPNAAEPVYFENEGFLNSKYIKETEKLRNEFSKKWNDESKPLEKQQEQIEEMLGKVKSRFVPSIKEICGFYKKCLDKGYYFQNTEAGRKAQDLMKRAVNQTDELCNDLLAIGDHTKVKSDYVTFNLLTCLQEILDDIDAHVSYVDEFTISEIMCKSDRKAFRDHVLMNIQENTNTHAFGTPKFKAKHVWERKVKVLVKEESGSIVIDVKNNGERFKGDVSKVFEDGYRYGMMRHSGHGMFSAKNTMSSLGGNIEFYASDICDQDSDFTTTIRIILTNSQ